MAKLKPWIVKHRGQKHGEHHCLAIVATRA